MIGVCANSPVSEGWKEEVNRVNTPTFDVVIMVAGKHIALAGSFIVVFDI
jgi:hypothetical protein